MSAGILSELKRRRVYQTVALYVVGAWLVIQVADVLFPAWNIPEAAKQYLVIGAFLGFPLVLFFGWRYDITTSGIKRTPPAGGGKESLPLANTDKPALAFLTITAVALLSWITYQVRELVIAPELADAPGIVDGSIAVLPFLNISDDPENDYFCDGISEELLLKLGEFRDLRVLGRASSFPFKGSELGIPRISEILGVRYLLQGSVRKDANVVRVSAQLVDNTGFQIWEESYDRELTSIFAIQREIAAAVANNLASVITSSPEQHRFHTPNIDAYQHFLLGREQFRRRTTHWPELASENFKKAIEADPDFPQPYAMLAVADLIGRSTIHQDEQLEYMQELIDKALELNPDLPEAHAAQGLYYTTKRPLDNVAAEISLRRALELDPNTPGAHNWLVIALNNQRKFEQAREERIKALERNPLDITLNVNVGLNYSSSGDFRSAERHVKKLLDLPGSERTVYANLRGIYESYGRYVEMIDASKKLSLAEAEVSGVPRTFLMAMKYCNLGHWDSALYWQEREERIVPNDLGTMFRRGFIFKMQGDYQGMWSHMHEVITAHGMDPQRLPYWAAQIYGAAHAMAGHHAEGIAAMEKTFDFSQPIRSTLGGGTFAVDFLNVLAWAYQHEEEHERAAEVLDYAMTNMQKWQDLGGMRSPGSQVTMALTQLLMGDTDAAMQTFELAVANNYRDYYFVWNDPRWDGVRDDPRFIEMMQQIKVDLDAMSERVREIDAEDNFEARLETAAAAGKAEST